MAGVSSFAFQGTNAHLVVASTSSEQTAHDHLKEKSACLLWRNEKILIKPHLHAFIQCAVQHLGNNSEFEFCIGFSSPGSSWLMDHRVGQYVIFPCTASLETADAAVNFGRCNRFSSCSTYCSFSLATLANTTLPFPIVLGKSADESSIIFVHVDNNSGQIIMQDRKPMIFFKACASEAILEHKSASKKVQAIHSITCRGLHMFDLTSLKDHSNFPQKSVKPSTFDGQVGAHKNDQIESQMKIIHRRAGFGQIVIRRDYVADGTWTHPAGTDCSLQVAFCISSKKIEKTIIPVSAQGYNVPEKYNRQGGVMLSSVFIDISSKASHVLDRPGAYRSGANVIINSLASRHVLSFTAGRATCTIKKPSILAESTDSDIMYIMSWHAVPAETTTLQRSFRQSCNTLGTYNHRTVSLRRINANGLASIAILQSLNSQLTEANLNTHARCYRVSPEVSFVALHASVRIAWCVAHVELPTKARLGSRRWSPNYQLARSLLLQRNLLSRTFDSSCSY